MSKPFNPNLVALGVCPDGRQSQQGDALRIEFSDPWVIMAPSEIVFEWSCDPCIGSWEHRLGDEVDFDNFKKWNTVPGDGVDFDFVCETTGECTTLWATYPGNEVPVAFHQPWVTYPGNQVPIAFECDSGGETPDFTFFTGYFEAGEGAALDADFEVTWISNVYAGEHFGAKLNDFTFESFGDIQTYDGAWIGGTTCGQPIPVLLEGKNSISDRVAFTASDNNATIQHTSFSSGRDGGNVGLDDVIDASGEIKISWAQDLFPAEWYSNDDTYAAGRFQIFLTDDYANLLTPTNSWTFRDSSWPTNSPDSISIWMPFGGESDGTIRYKAQGSGNNYGTVIGTLDLEGIDLYDGTKRISVIYRPLEESIELEVYVDEVLVGEAEIPLQPTAFIAPVWHYHNYNNPTPIYSIDSVEIVGCGEFLTTFPMQGFGVIDMREGAELDFALRTEMTIPMEFFSGETLHDLYLGSDVFLEDVEFHSGEFSAFDLTLNLPWEITANAYDGASATAALSTTTTLDFEFFSDATLQVQLSEAEFWSFYEGATFEFDLEIAPGDNFGSIDLFDGAALEGELSATHSLPVNIFSGETLHDLYLATDVYLDGVEFFSGETASFDLALNLPWEIIANAYDGAAGDIQIATVDTMRFWAYGGAQAEFDLDTRPSQDLLLQGYDGAEATASISISQALGAVSAYDGAYAVIPSLDNDQFWRMYEGAALEFEIATDTTLPANGYAGATLEVDLYTRPSEGLGIFRGYEGANLDLTLNIMVSAILYPNEIRAGIDFVCEFDVSTYFDLNNTACCPVKDSHERIELTDQPPPDEYYHGDKWLFTADLSTLPRFSMDAYEGAYSDIVDKDVYLTFSFFDGESFEVPTVAPEFTDFRLCYGNFIPDGDAVTVELVSIYDENCEEWPMYSGARMDMVLENNIQDQVNISAGATMLLELEHVPEMLLLAYSGEYARITNPEFVPRVYEGAQVNMTFEEPNWRVYEGAFMEITVTTDYDVEFLERGCLPNEFVPSNENGDPDWDRFNPVPVELDRYVHSILARCF